MSHFEEVREAYDEMVVRRVRRRDAIREELEARCAREEREDLENLARLLHRTYDEGMTKMEQRRATRQYQSPKFKTIWEAVPYEGETPVHRAETPKEQPFLRDGSMVTFTRDLGNWDWDGVLEETLTYSLKFSESVGRVVLTWEPEEATHARFNAVNIVEINKALEGIEL